MLTNWYFNYQKIINLISGKDFVSLRFKVLLKSVIFK